MSHYLSIYSFVKHGRDTFQGLPGMVAPYSTRMAVPSSTDGWH